LALQAARSRRASRRPHSTSDSEQIGWSLDKGRGEPETTPNMSTSISQGPGRMRPMSLANGLQNAHSPSIPASQVERQMAIQRNTDRTQTAWSSSEAGPFFFPLFYTEPTSEADLPKCSRRKVLKSRLTVNIPFITTGKKCRYLKAGLEICVLASERFVFLVRMVFLYCSLRQSDIGAVIVVRYFGFGLSSKCRCVCARLF
jgi:hypothetical protein